MPTYRYTGQQRINFRGHILEKGNTIDPETYLIENTLKERKDFEEVTPKEEKKPFGKRSSSEDAE